MTDPSPPQVPVVQLVRGAFVDTPDDPFAGGTLRIEEDGGLLVVDGIIRERGTWATVFASAERSHPQAELVDLRGGLVLPGFVDTHVHYPQTRAIGGLGMPLLDWLEQCALPEEARLADPAYAASAATEFMHGLTTAGTTTALVFGSHFADAVDALFTESSRVGLRVTAGLVVSDRILRDDLLTTPERSYEDGLALAQKWHRLGPGSLTRYVVTPRFSLSTSEAMLEACAALTSDVPGSYFTSHINENPVEISEVARLFAGSLDYLDTYDRRGLIGPRSILAHNVHATDRELDVLAGARAAVAHCPTSNSALGSGLFPLRRHIDHGVAVALGSDVGAGTGFSLLKEGLQAYFMQQLLGAHGLPLTTAHLLHLATRAGAKALGLDEEVGDFGVGRAFDAVWIRPAPGSTTDTVFQHAYDATAALAVLFALGGPADTAGVWVGGRRVLTR